MECIHYPGARKCSIIAPCCGRQYCCHQGHDKTFDIDHKIQRNEIETIICNECQEKQKFSNQCVKCGITFAEYYCEKCRLWRENGQYFHCDKCKICRIGKREDFKHCEKCDVCIPHTTIHTNCRSHNDDICAICLDETELIKYSRIPIIVLACSHAFHQNCILEYFKASPSQKCPICRVDLMDLEVQIKIKKTIDFLFENKNEYAGIISCISFGFTIYMGKPYFMSRTKTNFSPFDYIDPELQEKMLEMSNSYYTSMANYHDNQYYLACRMPDYIISKSSIREIVETGIAHFKLTKYQHTKCLVLMKEFKEMIQNNFRNVKNIDFRIPAHDPNLPEDECPEFDDAVKAHYEQQQRAEIQLNPVILQEEEPEMEEESDMEEPEMEEPEMEEYTEEELSSEEE